jgi:beta-glucosidase
MFQGFVISDWQGIDRITSPPHANYSYSVQAGVSAGIDMVNIIFISMIIRKKSNCC